MSDSKHEQMSTSEISAYVNSGWSANTISGRSVVSTWCSPKNLTQVTLTASDNSVASVNVIAWFSTPADEHGGMLCPVEILESLDLPLQIASELANLYAILAALEELSLALTPAIVRAFGRESR